MSSVVLRSPRSRYSKLSVITCVVLVWFHIQAVAAFWSFSWTNLLVAAVAVLGRRSGSASAWGITGSTRIAASRRTGCSSISSPSAAR